MIDWNSKKNYILVNPSYSVNQKKFIIETLKNIEIDHHVWVGTSGTTRNKWVALAKHAILKSASAVNRHLESCENDCWIHALPDFHVGGLGIWARASLSGARVIDYKRVHKKWDPILFRRLCIETRPTLSALVPTQLYDLVEARLQAPDSIRGIIIGGGALSEDLYFQARELGWCPLPSYGLSECASQVATASIESLKKQEYPRLDLLSHIDEVGIKDGKFMLRSESLLSYYAIIEKENMQLYDPKIDHWYLTEDVMSLENQSLKPLGRSDDFVKIGGESVNIARLNNILEEIMLSTCFKGDCALLAIPDQRLGHVIHLAISKKNQENYLELVSEYHKTILPFERIRKVHVIDQIPRTELKKLKKQELIKAIYASEAEHTL